MYHIKNKDGLSIPLKDAQTYDQALTHASFISSMDSQFTDYRVVQNVRRVENVSKPRTRVSRY